MKFSSHSAAQDGGAPSIPHRRPRPHPFANGLHRICKRIAARVQRGESQGRAVALFARRHNGKILAGGTKLRLSRFTLRRHFVAWKANPSPAAFALFYYGPQQSRVTVAMRREFISICAAPGVFNLMDAWRAMKARYGKRVLAGYRSFHRIFTASERLEIRRFHRARYAWKRSSLRFAEFERRQGR